MDGSTTTESTITRSTIARSTMTVHGHEVSYRSGGGGEEVLLFVHGMAGSSSTWVQVLEHLEDEDLSWVAPDLPGHGRSDKPRADYSLGAQAAFLRDILDELGHDRVTIVGTSLGGGIAMQFAYQHPERTERLVLVGSGGLGEEVAAVLRVLAFPGAELVLPVATQPVFRGAVEAVTGLLGKVGLTPAPATAEMWRSFTSLADPRTRTAFVQTLRSVVDHRGQRVSALDKVHLAQDVPTLIVWGAEDPIIPVSHAHVASAEMPASELVILEDCGHFPQVEQPRRFARTLVGFMADNPSDRPGVKLP